MAYAFDFPQISGMVAGQSTQGGAGQQTTQGKATGLTAGSGTKDVFSANAGKTAAPKAVGKAETAVASAGQSLQDEANSYMTGVQGADYGKGLGTADLDKAVGGDANATATAQSRLAQTQADQVAGFKPTTNVNIDDAAQASTEAGVGKLLRREGGANYNSSDAAFDAHLLQKDKNFAQVRSMLSADQQALLDKYDNLTGNGKDPNAGLETQAQKIAQDKTDAATKSARDYLQGKETGLQADVNKTVADANAKRKGYQTKGDPTFLATEKSQAVNELIADMMKDPASAKKLQPFFLQAIADKGGINAGDYYSAGPDVAAGDVTTADQAFKFNNVMSLLGQGGPSWVAGKGAGAGEGFDKKAYKQAIMDHVMKASNGADAAEAVIGQQQQAADQAVKTAQKAKADNDAMKAKIAADQAAAEAAAKAAAQSDANNPFRQAAAGTATPAGRNSVPEKIQGALADAGSNLGSGINQAADTVNTVTTGLDTGTKVNVGGKSKKYWG